MIKATYFETFCGNDYFRDKYGNIYTKVGKDVAFCSNLKQGHLTEDKGVKIDLKSSEWTECKRRYIERYRK